MGKQYKNLILAIVAVAVLLGIFLCVRLLPDKKEEEDSKPQAETTVSLLKSEKTDIKSVLIKNPDNTIQIDVTKEEDKTVYKMSDTPEGRELQNSEIESLLGTLSDVKSTKTIAENSENLSAYGLDSDNKQITVTYNDGTTKKLTLGSNTPFNTGSYVKLDGDEKVYLVSLSDARVFSDKIEDFLVPKKTEKSNDDQNKYESEKPEPDLEPEPEPQPEPELKKDESQSDQSDSNTSDSSKPEDNKSEDNKSENDNSENNKSEDDSSIDSSAKPEEEANPKLDAVH